MNLHPAFYSSFATPLFSFTGSGLRYKVEWVEDKIEPGDKRGWRIACSRSLIGQSVTTLGCDWLAWSVWRSLGGGCACAARSELINNQWRRGQWSEHHQPHLAECHKWHRGDIRVTSRQTSSSPPSSTWAEVSWEAVFRAPELLPFLMLVLSQPFSPALRCLVPGTVATVVRRWWATASRERLSYTKDLVKMTKNIPMNVEFLPNTKKLFY